jgi:UDP-N-acetylglucosamine:LPS N-acetylglucosamine transferase
MALKTAAHMQRDRLHPRPRVLAISSAGGHWVQLRRMRPAWEECDVAYATSNTSYRQEVEADNPSARFYTFPEATRWDKTRLVRQLFKVIMILLRERPDVVITTGASAGYFALRVAKVLRSRTVWIDSIANAAELSLAGRKAGPHADMWLTQWPHLAGANELSGRGPDFRGTVV